MTLRLSLEGFQWRFSTDILVVTLKREKRIIVLRKGKHIINQWLK